MKPTCLYSQSALASDSHSHGTRQALRGVFKPPYSEIRCFKKNCDVLGDHFLEQTIKKNLVSITSKVAFREKKISVTKKCHTEINFVGPNFILGI